MNRGGKRSGSKTQSNRTVFNVEKDIVLLKSVLQHNPYQTDERNWEDVLKDVKDQFNDFPQTLSVRTIRGRVNLLVKQIQGKQLIVKTGKEEQCSERGNLLLDLISVIESMDQPINSEIGPDEEQDFVTDEQNTQLSDIFFSQDEFNAAGILVGSSKSQQLSAKNEKISADKERDSLVSALNSDLAPSPKDIPVKAPKRKLTFEDELIKTKHAHEMNLDTKRLVLEEKKQDNDYVLENRRLEIEKVKLELELKREDRLAEECKRREDAVNMQIDTQKKMFDLMLQLASKFNQNS